MSRFTRWYYWSRGIRLGLYLEINANGDLKQALVCWDPEAPTFTAEGRDRFRQIKKSFVHDCQRELGFLLGRVRFSICDDTDLIERCAA